MTRQEAIARLCRLVAEVHGSVIGYDHASDCFCKEGGLWSARSYAESDYRNDGTAIEWIEKLVRREIAQAGVTEGGDANGGSVKPEGLNSTRSPQAMRSGEG